MENNIIKINDETFDEVINNNKIVLVDFSASWCGPCKALAVTINELAKEYKDNPDIVIAKVDVDESPELCETFRINSVPSVIFFVNTETEDRLVGNLPKIEYQKIINKYLEK